MQLKITALAFLVVVFARVAMAADVKQLEKRAVEPLPAKPEVQILTVSYEPGESSIPHRHNAHTFIYVLEGQVRMHVEGGKPAVLSAGDTFYESPTDIHIVSANVSQTEAAKFLVFFVKEAGTEPTRAVD
ncbi:cupin domain-containing protein [Proteobacteria bacterium 005FR1]|nr:cupin domain-containing protein [Proteobacteria bacterium 005FR1]